MKNGAEVRAVSTKRAQQRAVVVRNVGYFSVSAPAFATTPSCGEVTPDTPMAPMTLRWLRFFS
jgi:hypothetical protein